LKVVEPPSAKNRMHFDLRAPDSVSAEVQRLTDLGAAVQERFEIHTIMTDPEGNVFCVELGPAD
jgi:Glyoxalase-like domain